MVILINWTSALCLQNWALFQFFKDQWWGKMGHPKKSSIKKFQIAEISKKWLGMIVKKLKIMKNEKKSSKIAKNNRWGKMGHR